MQIGVPGQHAPEERRVGLVPDVVKKLVDGGHQVIVESGAGERAGYLDGSYRDAGATIGDASDAWSADFVASVDPPGPDAGFTGQSLIGLLSPFDEPDRIRQLATSGAFIFAFEAIPRTTRAQLVDALSSQATAAGYQAGIEAAAACDRFFPMLTTAAGTIRPSKVVILGAGVAGLQAIATARRLGAVVSAFDVRVEAAEQVESLGASFIRIDIEAQDARETGGYAREVADDEQSRIMAGLAPHISGADAVITTAAIPGRPAPRLITKDMVESMRPGSVIVDLAASTGGNCDLTQAGSTIRHAGVTVIGATDFPSRVAGHASQMYARNVANFIELVTGEDGEFSPDLTDDILAEACVAREGRVVHPRLES